MKKFISLILLAGWVLTSYSQNVIQLEETRVNFDPSAKIIFEDYDSGIIKVKENYAEQFHSDAIAFIKENFDIQRFLDIQGKFNGDVIITAVSARGFLRATYDRHGNLVRNFQKFKDVVLPYEIRNQVYSRYQGWAMLSNKYIASGNGETLDKQRYSVQLQKGNKREKLNLKPAVNSLKGVASLD